jgi:hypothetical protein
VQVPVGVLDVQHHVPHRGFETGQGDVRIDPGQDDRDAVDHRAAPAQQRLIPPHFERRGPDAGHFLTGVARPVPTPVVRLIGHGESSTGRGLLDQVGSQPTIVSVSQGGEGAGRKRDVSVERPIRTVQDRAALGAGHAKQRIEIGERRFDAARLVRGHAVHRRGPGSRAAGRRLLNGRIVDRRRAAGPAHQSVRETERRHAAQVADHLAVVQRDRDALFQRQIPDLVEFRVRDRQRRMGIRRVRQTGRVDVGILDLRRAVQVVRQIAVRVEIERLRRVAAREDGHPDQQQSDVRLELPTHRMAHSYRVAWLVPVDASGRKGEIKSSKRNRSASRKQSHPECWKKGPPFLPRAAADGRFT